MDIDRVRELAGLHALGILDGEDAREFARLLEAGDPLVRAEMAAFDDVTVALALSAPPVKPSPDVKERLMRSLPPKPRADPPWALLKRLLPREAGGFASVHGAELSGWRKLPVPGAFFKLLSVDIERGFAVTLGKLDPGASFPEHEHSGAEDIYMLSGDLRIGEEVLHAGDFHHAAAGTHHPENSSASGCTALIIVSTQDLLAQLKHS